MEGPAFWNELESQFRSVAQKCRGSSLDLYATFDDTDLSQRAAFLGQQVTRLIRDPASSFDAVFVLTRDAIRCAMVAQKRAGSVGHWEIGRGTPEQHERDVVRTTFESLAARAALAADVTTPGAAPEQAVQAWLHLLKQGDSAYLKFLRLNHLITASATDAGSSGRHCPVWCATRRMPERGRRIGRRSHQAPSVGKGLTWPV